MRNTLTLSSVLLLFAVLGSCGDHGSVPHSPEHDSHATRVDQAAQEEGFDRLELNQGRRWGMDDHTRSVFARMEASLLTADLDALEGEGLKHAGSGLQTDINELIAGCTMTGDAHDQLHLYLTGFVPAVTAMSESGLVEDAQKVTHYLERYDEYFE